MFLKQRAETGSLEAASNSYRSERIYNEFKSQELRLACPGRSLKQLRRLHPPCLRSQWTGHTEDLN